jgi:hypothetical protein
MTDFHREFPCGGNNVELYSWRYRVGISSRSPAVLAEYFRSFSQSLKMNAGRI